MNGARYAAVRGDGLRESSANDGTSVAALF